MQDDYMSDRMRVECALPAAIFLRLVGDAHHQAHRRLPTSEEEEPVFFLLLSACEEALRTGDDAKTESLKRRVDALVTEIFALHAKTVPMAKLLVMTLWTQRLLNDDRLILVEGSAAAKGIDAIVNELQKARKTWLSFEKGCVKQAEKLDKILRKKGYYN
jgi:hypothetical protein